MRQRTKSSPAAAPAPGPRSWRRCAHLRTSKASSPPLTTAGSISPRLTGWKHSAAIRASEKSMRRPRQRPPLPRGQAVGAEPDEGSRCCYPTADARGSPRLRRTLWAHLYRLRQRQAACGNAAHTGAPPEQRSGGGVAGIGRATAADHAAPTAQVAGWEAA